MIHDKWKILNMLIPPQYIFTHEISSLLQRIEAVKSVLDTITIPPEVETNIRRQSILKSSLFSARIEGNPLTLAEVTGKPSKDQRKNEVFNILKAMQMVHQREKRDLTTSFLLDLHQKVMTGLADKKYKGSFRTEQNAIFNAAGIAIYLPPPPRQIKPAMERLMKFINSDKERFIPIRACLTHYSFEKIHPFLDGNGRIGRLILQAVLQKSGYGMKGLLSVEEYLDNHRPSYYRALEAGERDVTDFLIFMLEAIAITAEQVKEQVLAKEKAEPEDYLLPRRAEILNIIKDHGLVNFDILRRRFMAVNERTLRYDLKQLQNAGLIRKLGTTKGVYYEVANSKL
jgi:Fic family protein